MPWPVFDHIWRHESYKSPLPSNRILDLSGKREKEGKRFLYKFKHFHKINVLNSL